MITCRNQKLLSGVALAKKLFWEISQYLQESICDGIVFLVTFFKVSWKTSLLQIFSVQFAYIFRIAISQNTSKRLLLGTTRVTTYLFLISIHIFECADHNTRLLCFLFSLLKKIFQIHAFFLGVSNEVINLIDKRILE